MKLGAIPVIDIVVELAFQISQNVLLYI